MNRFIIISNRLPFSVDHDGEKMSVRQSSGGLVSAIRSYFDNDAESKKKFEKRIWVGVADFSREEWQVIKKEHLGQLDFEIHPIFLDKTLYNEYYNGFSNSVIWPLFHYFASFTEYKTSYFESFREVNRLFADQLIRLLDPGDTIWIHDYQLMLLPELLREVNSKLTIGFFLHIPFPSYEVFRLLPGEWKTTLLKGVLGSDLIGFHTYDYVQHFLQSVKMIMGVDNYFRSIQYKDRFVKIDLFPIGIDYKRFSAVNDNEEIQKKKKEFEKNFQNQKIVFSVDRLDYSKGIMNRLMSIEYLFNNFPEWKEKVVFILNIVPSRDTIKAYHDWKKKIEEMVSTVNGRLSTINWQPIIYRYNHLDFSELIALYQAADVALVTPLRDGMNLVAKEYVASCRKRGVLVLSELAGAASELNEALLVNPNDVPDVSAAVHRALTMPPEEQAQRLELMQQRLQDYDVVRWVNDFLDQLASVKKEQRSLQMKLLGDRETAVLSRQYNRAEKRCLLLDYDGTLVPFSTSPALAVPGPELNHLLQQLSSDNNNNIVIISGRDAHTLERWFGSLPVTLVAEHGASFKYKNEAWQQLVSVSTVWKEQLKPLLHHFVTRCSGSFIEEKTNSIAWHYRNTQPDLGFSRSRELLNNLSQFIQNTPLQVIDGNKVVEVRIAGLDKGAIALKIVNETNPDFVLCIGDDSTDEDMFKALDNKANTIKVGYGGTNARHTILAQEQVLPFLYKLTAPLREIQYAAS